MQTLHHLTKKIFLLLLLFYANELNAQVAIEWQKCLGGPGTDIANSIRQTSDGGYVVAGFSNANNGDVTGNHGGSDYWIVKLDGSANIQWQKSFGGADIDRANSVQQTSDGGYVVAGYSWSNDGDVTGNHGGYDYWVVKLDGSGNLQWKNALGGTGHDQATAVQQTSDWGYVVAGYSNSTDGDVTGNHGGYDIWVVKLDDNGNLQWQKCLGGAGDDRAYSVQQTSDGGYVLAGNSSSNNGDVTGNHGGQDYWVVKLDGIGNIQWQKSLGGAIYDKAQSIQQTSDGGYVVAGTTVSNDGDVTGNNGTWDYWVVKLDGSGNLQWQKCLGGTSYDYAYSVQRTIDSGYMVAGWSGSNNGNVTGNHGGNDYWVVKLDGKGIFQWQKSLGGTNNDFAYSIQQTSDGSYVMAGESASNNGDVTGNHGVVDFWVVKLTENYNSITGKLYADLNSNNVQDAGEPVLANKKVTEQNSNRFGFSGPTGEYSVLVLDSGNYSVAAEPLNNYTSAPLAHNANFSSIQQTDSLNDFAFQPNGVFNDLCITITPATAFRTGMNAIYVINYENVGTTTINNCSVIFFPHNAVSYVGSNVTPFSVVPDSVIWNIGTLTPFQTGNLVVTVNVTVGTPIGSTINSGARIEPVAGDANPNCNTHYWEVITTGAVDPNDILVNRTTLFTTEFPNPPFLEYIIRFQNVGNDTAFTVRIFNPIDTNKLELNTLDFVSSSHPVDMQYVFHERYMKFTFNNILLPDSTTNEPMSHGFVRYKIKPKPNLVVNDSISNDATIHFDFEAPVLTNTAITKVVLPTGIGTAAVAAAVEVYPNPSSGDVTVSLLLKQDAEVEMNVFNAMGQIAITTTGKYSSGKNEINISATNFPNGIYYLKVSVEGSVVVRKLVKL